MIVLFVVSGLFSGLLGGLLGIGGGVVTVPILYFVFEYMGIGGDFVMQVAVSTSLAASVVTSSVATFVQIQNRMVLFSVLKLILPGLFIGCILGSIAAHVLPSNFLRMIFASMATLLGLYFCFPKLPAPYLASAPNRTLSLFGLGIGALSTLLGIGGGSLTFPVFLGYQIPAKNSSATSSASTLVTTLVGSITFLLIAWHEPTLPDTFGYIEIVPFLAISGGSILTSPIGAKLAQTLPVTHIKQIFGASLTLIALSMFVF